MNRLKNLLSCLDKYKNEVTVEQNPDNIIYITSAKFFKCGNH